MGRGVCFGLNLIVKFFDRKFELIANIKMASFVNSKRLKASQNWRTAVSDSKTVVKLAHL
jgi:hypothetical protein